MDNINLLCRVQELEGSAQAHLAIKSRFCEIQDPLTWAFCFLSFMGVKVDHPETRELAAYGQLIIHLSRKHSGRGWLLYDTLFRQQKAVGRIAPWSELSSSIVSSTVLETKSCNLCFSSDHISAECAMRFLESQSERSQGSGGRSTSHPENRPAHYKPYSPGVCRRFNRGTYCSAASCKFEHICNICFTQGHNALDCPKERRKSGPAVAP